MTATASESVNLYWHCSAAEGLIRQFMPHLNAAVSSNIRHAVRMATLCAAGKNGIQYATEAAMAQKIARGGDWHTCGLIREHAIPISLIHDEILRVARDYFVEPKCWSDVAGALHPHDRENWPVPKDTSRPAPLSAVIAAVIRRRTVLVWATADDDRKLKREGLNKTMPANKGADSPLARYEHCQIKLIDLRQSVD